MAKRDEPAMWKDVPAPRRAIMRANRRRDTRPELKLRRALHLRGLRYRVDFPVRPTGGRPVRPDIVFPSKRIAVFVDGCFWHGCPLHWTRSATNRRYWDEKVAANKARDKRTTAALEQDEWMVLRFWEHEDSTQAANQVEQAVHRQSRRKN